MAANPEVWSKTVFFIMYDENDGFFDHVVPPTPPQTAAQGLSTVSIVNEIYPGNATAGYQSGPYGLGARVPMLVVSPWSKGGWVSSEVFDHTSLIRFVQKRFGTAAHPLTDSNITPWRAAVSGDLTSAFNFATPNSTKVALPSTAAYVPPDNQRHNSYIPSPPVLQASPVQEPGTRPARPVPYVPNVNFTAAPSTGKLQIEFLNTGTKAAFYQVRSGSTLVAPRGYTVSPKASLSDSWQFAAFGLQAYELFVYGPNGFFRSYKGGLVAAKSANLQSMISYDLAGGGVTLTVLNSGTTAVELQITNVYTNQTITATLYPNAKFTQFYSTTKYANWYDIHIGVESDSTFAQQLAGHMETGQPSTTDPAIAAS